MARALAADPLVLLMDEPFSAVDPIVRARLQEEFLRLQAAVRKTIVLVTHDIDEAVRLGDRIAVLAEGGRLLQYASPAELLGNPASDTVREFVGADRGIRRLAVTPIRDAMRPLGQIEDIGRLPTVDADGTLYDALAAMLTADSLQRRGARGRQAGRHGVPVGHLRGAQPGSRGQGLTSPAARPDASAGQDPAAPRRRTRWGMPRPGRAGGQRVPRRPPSVARPTIQPTKRP